MCFGGYVTSKKPKSQRSRKPKDQWDTNLPDTAQWLPRSATQTLGKAFVKRCQGIERKILLLAELERQMNIDNYDSGIGVEDIMRDELRELLPTRYSVRAGVIDDCKGRTAGDFEIIIANDVWFTPVKAGATKESRRFHFPIEAVYAVLEVKQTLTYNTLDEAMGKLVKCHRLNRPSTELDRVVENQSSGYRRKGYPSQNTLYSAIIATDLDSGISMDDMVKRFCAINETLKPEERVRSLCILGQGVINSGYRGDNDFQHLVHNLDKPPAVMLYKLQDIQCAFYPFICGLLIHLFYTILKPEDIVLTYGHEKMEIFVMEKDLNV